MKKKFKAVLGKFISFFFARKKTEGESVLSKIRLLPHSCALCALYQVVPEFTSEELENTFKLCTDNMWPNRGVTNREFNIALKYLDVFNRFQYTDRDSKISDILKLESNVIALVHGHYTVIKKGQVEDKYEYYPKNDSYVYCYWLLKQ